MAKGLMTYDDDDLERLIELKKRRDVIRARAQCTEKDVPYAYDVLM